MKPIEEKPKKGSEKGNSTVMWIVFNTKKQGLETVMKDYWEMAMRFLWERGEEGAISKDTWLHVNKLLMEKGRSIARAETPGFLDIRKIVAGRKTLPPARRVLLPGLN